MLPFIVVYCKLYELQQHVCEKNTAAFILKIFQRFKSTLAFYFLICG